MKKINFEKWFAETEKKLMALEKRLSISGNQEIDIGKIELDDYVNSLISLANESHEPDYSRTSAEAYRLLREIFEQYLVSSEVQQRLIERVFDQKPSILKFVVAFPSYVSDFVLSSKDASWVKLGATAALIAEGRTDYRDLWRSLGSLYNEARRHGLDPEQCFNEVESLKSISQDLYPSVNVGRGILGDFLNSDYLASIT